MPRPNAFPIPCLTLAQRRRFESKTIPEPNTGCLLWIGTMRPNGYGAFCVGGVTYPAHRVSVALTGRRVPINRLADHRCRTPLCVNAEHLRMVTCRENSIENSLSVSALNAAMTACGRCRGPFGTLSNGQRRCRRCLRAAAAKAKSLRYQRDPEFARRLRRASARRYSEMHVQINARRRHAYATNPDYRQRRKDSARSTRAGNQTKQFAETR